MSDTDEIVRRARRRQAALLRQRRDPRFRRVLGRLVAARLLVTNEPVKTHDKPLRVADALWAGEFEPRILELLPALLIKRPGLFIDPRNLPEDLARTIIDLRRGRTPADFRGLDGSTIVRWLPVVGHRDKLPSRLCSFRLQVHDLALLTELSAELGITRTAVIRRALGELALRHTKPRVSVTEPA